MSIINYLRLSRTDSDELSVITAKQGDNLGDVCQIEVYDNQTIVELSNYDDILFYANKPDKSSILFRLSDEKSNFTKNNNTLNLTLTDALLAVHGTVKCEISFYKGTEIKSTYDFNIYVFKSPGSYDNLNVSDLETIKNAVQKVEGAESSAKKSAENAKQSELNAEASAVASANSASSALSSANLATTKADEAKVSADNAVSSANTATDKANEAAQSALNASNSADLAKTSETNAKTSEDNSKTYADNALDSATSSKDSAKLSESWAIGGTDTRTGEDADNSKYYAEQSSTHATNAKVSETNSKASETNSKISEDNAKTYASNASAYASDASTSASNAKVSETNAENFASLANTSADTATTEASEALASANSAATSATEAESFAYGNGTRENDNIDNAKYYYQQAKAISESFSGALRPMGTVAFNDLPSIDTVTAGDMYNISDEFITTSDFKEGSGLTIPMGSNIYKLPEGKWDILAGSPVTGVKGNAETIYRKGNVNITPENIGLGNVPNVSTNNQTPTYSDTTSFETLSSGEKLSVAFSKIKLAISNLISHIGNKSNPHDVTKTQVGLGNVDNTADSQKSVKYASTAGIADTLNSDMADLENIKSTFTEATVRENLVSEETLGTLLGKIKKWFSDLKPHVFKDLVTNTTTTTTGYGLDATVGKVLQGEIDTLNNNLPDAGGVFTYNDDNTKKMAMIARYISDKSTKTHLYSFSTNTREDNSVIPKIFIDSEAFCPAMILPDSNTTGSAIQPVYLNDGYIAKCKYTLETSVPSDAKFTDTKNTAGTTNKVGAKMFLVGATSQAANLQTYSNVNVYVGTDNELYSNGKKVAHHEDLDNKQSSLTRIEKLFSNVNILTQSSTGAYYTVLGNLADIIGSGKTLFGFWMGDFGNCSGIITPYCDGTKVYVMSSTEQLNISVSIFFVYA